MKYLGVIPAKFASKRFPGKLLHSLMGKPVLSWVIEYAQKIDFLSGLLVATDDEEIASFVLKNHRDVKVFKNQIPVSCGSQRILEISKAFPHFGVYITIPADEPLVDYKEINRIKNVLRMNFSGDIATLYTKFYNKEDLESNLSCKIITNRKDHMLYNSRVVIPIYKDGSRLPLQEYKKHVGLMFFSDYFLYKEGDDLWSDWHSSMTETENLEQNRFIDFGARVQMFEIKHNYFGVDQKWQIDSLEERYKKLNS